MYSVKSGSSTAVVKRKKANELGPYDINGNVCEWCFDLNGSYRVLRSGSWRLISSYLRAGYRGNDYSDHEYMDIGFRFERSHKTFKVIIFF